MLFWKTDAAPTGWQGSRPRLVDLRRSRASPERAQHGWLLHSPLPYVTPLRSWPRLNDQPKPLPWAGMCDPVGVMPKDHCEALIPLTQTGIVFGS